MSYMEYKEFQVPESVQQTLEELSSKGEAATLGAGGFFEWLNGLAKEEGWRAVWQGFNYPFIVLEREVVVVEEVKN